VEDLGCWYNDAHVHQSALREGGKSVDLAARLVNKDNVTKDDRGRGELHARLSSLLGFARVVCLVDHKELETGEKKTSSFLDESQSP
jgi:hypothetical protein